MDNETKETILKVLVVIGGIILFIGIIYGLYYIITYREQVTVLVTDKYWHYYLDVRYDESHTRLVTKTRENCTGFGKDRKCSKDTYLDTEHYTDTHIVCKGERDGYELPPERPLLDCKKSGNQYERQDISYHLVFEEDGKNKTATFNGNLWSNLRIGKLNRVERDFFGSIVAYIGE